MVAGIRGLGSLAGGCLDRARVGNGSAFAEHLHGEVTHGVEAESETGKILSAQAADSFCFLAKTGDLAGKIKLAQVGIDDGAIKILAGDAAGLTQMRGAGVRVGCRERLVREPGVGDESSRARGTHHVATPKRIDAENCVGHIFPKLVHYNFSFFSEPNHK